MYGNCAGVARFDDAKPLDCADVVGAYRRAHPSVPPIAMITSYTFAADYFMLVFIAGVGVIQAAASIGGLKGLLIVKHPLAARISGLGLAVCAFIWFFTNSNWNINDYEGGLDTNDQALVFFLGIAAAGALTVALSSLVNMRMRDGSPTPDAGIGALRRVCYFRALAHNLKRWRAGEDVGGRG